MIHQEATKFFCYQFRILFIQLQWMFYILYATLLEKYSVLLYSREMGYKQWLSLNQSFVPRKLKQHSMEQIYMLDVAH